MPNLDTLLSFPTHGAGPSTAAERTPIPPRSSHILVTDTTDSPALFVLAHFLRASHAINRARRSSVLDRKGKSRAHTKVIWLGCNSDGIVHLKNVARKSGVHLDEETRDGAFCYVDANAEVLSLEEGEGGIADSMATMRVHDGQSRAEQSLHTLYKKVAEELANAGTSDSAGTKSVDWTSRNLIVVDDLTALAWTLDPSDSFGQPVHVARQLNEWLGALTSLAAKNQASVITLMHADATSCSKTGASDPVDESLLTSLLQKADVWVEVKELASGRARDCDGEITVHPLVRPSLARAPSAPTRYQHSTSRDIPPLQAFAIDTPCPNRSKAVLYRIAPDGQSAALGGASVGSNTGRVQVWARGTGRGFL
ncbi:uncharacterized protein UTRI_00202_B [Ustilago trichophora]|uniref:Uncharacterized protein n=1 Tax=Ustilago trichophora TaxID=86804 RepID=A0A5C3DS64_9BASI|nr:uncharacterized protein UTRI_00202_B [Ustilago trichophora]